MSWDGLLNGLSNFGSGAMEFAKANPTLTGAALGAGAGYLADGGQGALLGGALGGGVGYGAGQGLLGDGMQEYLSGADKSYDVGSMLGFGGTSKANPNQVAQDGTLGYMDTLGQYHAEAAMPIREVASGSGIMNYGSGLLEGASDFSKKYEGLIDFGKDAFDAYGTYTKNQSSTDMNQAQMDYIKNLQRMQTEDNLYKQNARSRMQSNIDTGYGSSSMSNYYTA